MGVIQARAQHLAQRSFTGGLDADFERAGRLQLSTLIETGLEPSHRLLDVGCGAVRAGYWLMHFLDPGCYFGIEPNREMLAHAIDVVLEPDLLERSKPTFEHNDDFDFSVFGVKFDVLLARSIWTHASKPQIESMLDGFVDNSTSSAYFLTSFLPSRARILPRRRRRDYDGDGWVGRSHQSDRPGLVAHDERWIRAACAARGLSAHRLPAKVMNNQCWLRIEWAST